MRRLFTVLLLLSALALAATNPPVFSAGTSVQVNPPASSLPIDERKPAIGDGFIAWEAAATFTSPRIYVRFLDGGRQTPVSTLKGSQLHPVAAGPRIGWLQQRGGSYYPMVKTLPNGGASTLASRPADASRGIAISEMGWVAWVDEASGNIRLVRGGQDQGTSGQDDGANEIRPPAGWRVQGVSLGGNLLAWTEEKGGQGRIGVRGLSKGQTRYFGPMTARLGNLANNGRLVAFVFQEENQTGVRLIHLTEDLQPVTKIGRFFESITDKYAEAGDPSFSGDFLFFAWSQEEARGINAYHLPSKGSIAVTQGVTAVDNVVAKGSLLAWREEEEGLTPDLPDGDIRAAKTSLGSKSPTSTRFSKPLTVSTDKPSVAPHYTPAMDDQNIVWVDNRDGHFGVYGRNIDSGKAFTVEPGNVGAAATPTVATPHVAWVDLSADRGDLMLKDIRRGGTRRLGGQASVDSEPKLDRGRLVWIRRLGAHSQLLIAPASAPTEIQILRTSPTLNNPSLKGDWLAWEEGKPERPADTDVYALNLSSSRLMPLATDSAVAGNPAVVDEGILWTVTEGQESKIVFRRFDQPQARVVSMQPSPQLAGISGSEVVWLARGENGHAMLAQSLETGRQRVLERGGWAMANPSVRGELLLWEDNRSENFNILLRRLDGKAVQAGIGKQFNPEPLPELKKLRFQDPDPGAGSRGPGCGLVGG